MASYDDFVHIPTPPAQTTYNLNSTYLANARRDRLSTSALVTGSLRLLYPKHHLSITPAALCDLLAYARAHKNVTVTPANEKEDIKERIFLPLARRYGDENGGAFLDRIVFGSYSYNFDGTEFLLYVVEGAEDGVPYGKVSYNYLLLPVDDEGARGQAQGKIDGLLKAATSWALELHNEVLVYDQGYWQKNSALWQSIQKSEWADVILDEKRKETIIQDVLGFFDNEKRYQEFNVPWKRGVIFYGPPGNGKTISTKALMHDISKRKNPAVEALYVKTFTALGGPERGIRMIFEKARQMAPCMLIFEDIDSLVSPMVRAYFLNEVDGLESNHGILMVASTNHLERLDPGIAKRPSRFDRKYLFDVPDREERVKYCEYWRNKLRDNRKVEFPQEMSGRIADITEEFSFAYLKEAFVAALLMIVGKSDDNDDGLVGGRYRGDPLSDNVLWNEIKRQVENLRKEIEDENVENDGGSTTGVPSGVFPSLSDFLSGEEMTSPIAIRNRLNLESQDNAGLRYL